MQLRWPDGFRCPRCGCRESSPVRTVLLRCRDCRHQTSVTAGTIFQDTRTSLRLWFQAVWWMTSQKNGVSALGLQRVLGLHSYETAWTWLHKLRRAMVRPGRDLLTGRVDVDECYIGGLEEGLPGRLNLDKALIVVAAQEDGPGIGRIRMRQIVDASAQSLVPFVQDSVEPGSVIHTDGWLGYAPLEKKGYEHEITFLRGKKKTPSELMPRVHRVISLLKRWLMGTHQGAVSHKHLDYYLDEFTFRFNRYYLRRTCDDIWVIDCSPEGYQPEVNTRIFQAVQQPVCIVLASRSAKSTTSANVPAKVMFQTLLLGRRDEKFKAPARYGLRVLHGPNVRRSGAFPFCPHPPEPGRRFRVWKTCLS